MNKYLKNIYKDIKSKTTSERIDILSREYFSKSIESRKIIRYDLEISINTLDKLSLVSIAFTFLIPAFTNLYGKNTLIGIAFFIAYGFFMMYFIPKAVFQHNFYKLYLKIIEDIEMGNIIKKTKDDNIVIEILSNAKES